MSAKKKPERILERRQNVVDRRCGIDLRPPSQQIERRSGMDRRRGPGIRRSPERKAAEQGQMTDEQFEFLMAIDKYKRLNQRPFPTWTEVLEVIKALGYRKVADPCPIDKLPEVLEKEALQTVETS